jgi:hypothetical protein
MNENDDDANGEDDDDDDDEDNDDCVSAYDLKIVSIIDTIDKYCQPTVSGWQYKKDHDRLLRETLEKIANKIDRLPNDPGKLFPLHERVQQVISALCSEVRK